MNLKELTFNLLVVEINGVLEQWSLWLQNAFHAVGHEGQFFTIVPLHDTLIVRLGKAWYPQLGSTMFLSAICSPLCVNGDNLWVVLAQLHNKNVGTQRD